MPTLMDPNSVLAALQQGQVPVPEGSFRTGLPLVGDQDMIKPPPVVDPNDPISFIRNYDRGIEHTPNGLELSQMTNALMGQKTGDVVPFPQTIEGMHNDLLGHTGPSTVDRKLQSALIRQSPDNVVGAINGGKGVAITGYDPNGLFLTKPINRGGGGGGGFFPPKM